MNAAAVPSVTGLEAGAIDTSGGDGPGTTASSRFDSGLPAAVQTAAAAAQSADAGSTTVTSASVRGAMTISRRSSRPSTRRALRTSPFVTARLWSRSTLKLTVTASLNRIRNENVPEPACLAGRSTKLAVRGGPSRVTVTV